MSNTVEKMKPERPKRNTLARIVQVGITNFERSHPGYVLSKAAKSLVVKHALRHEDQVLRAFRSRTLTQDQFLNGLTQTLEAAQGARIYYKRKTLGKHILTYETVERLHSNEISASAVQKAMKKKCKTFPWC